MLTIFLTLVVAICWSLPYFLIKDISNYISNTEIIVLSHFIWHVFILSFAIFIWIFKRNKATNFIESIKKAPNKIKLYLLSLTFIGIISQLAYFKLLKQNDVSKIIPILNGLSNIAIILLAYFIFKEDITFMKVIGIVLVVLGIYLIK